MRRMEEVHVLVLHNEGDGQGILDRLRADPCFRPALARTPEEFMAAPRPEGRHAAVIGHWAPESRLAEIIAWSRGRFPEDRILACAVSPEEILPLVLAGAGGYLLPESLGGIAEALHSLLDQGFHFPTLRGRRFMEELIESNRLYQAFVNAGITPREIEIIRMQIAEKSRSKAARRMGVELATVKSHNRIILKKLGLAFMKDVIRVYGRCLGGGPP